MQLRINRVCNDVIDVLCINLVPRLPRFKMAEEEEVDVLGLRSRLRDEFVFVNKQKQRLEKEYNSTNMKSSTNNLLNETGESAVNDSMVVYMMLKKGKHIICIASHYN